MEWLIGKARGVSRGFIGSNNAATTSVHTISTGSSGLNGDSIHTYSQSAYAEQELYPHAPHQFPRLVDPLPFMDHNEWIASHTVGLYDNVGILYDAIYELCVCPAMTGPGSLTYVATDDRGKKIKCTARQYIDSVLAQCQDLVTSHHLFPTRHGGTFPPDFRAHVALICRSLLRVLAHLYAAHFSQIDGLELVAHLNTVARHFFAFVARFRLVDEKDLEVLGDLSSALFRFQASPCSTNDTLTTNTLPILSDLPADSAVSSSSLLLAESDQ